MWSSRNGLPCGSIWAVSAGCWWMHAGMQRVSGRVSGGMFLVYVTFLIVSRDYLFILYRTPIM
jgi:hypothetical protein